MTHVKGKGYVPKFHIPTPSALLNKHLSEGGIPSGAIMQIQSAGPGTFKTSFAIQMMANALNMGLDVAYIDGEGALNNKDEADGRISNQWLTQLGVDVNNIYIVDPGPGEELWESVYSLSNQGVKLIVMDSIHSVQPTKIHEDEMGSHHIGLHAKLHTVGLLKALPILRKNDTILIGINHLKVNLTQQGVMGKKPTGGEAWSFYSQFMFENIRSGSKSKLEGKDIIPLEIYISKNKGGPQFIKVDTYAKQGYGIFMEGELVELALESGVITKKGAWYRDFNGEVISNQIEVVSQWAKENKDLILA
jgi:recombination protein RecA